MLYPQPSLVQSEFVEITTSVSTSSTSYVDLLTCDITTAGNPIEVHFTACAASSSALSVGFRLLIDGVFVNGARGRIMAAANPAQTTCPSLRYMTGPLSAGLHTVTIQWRTLVLLTTVQIRPSPDYAIYEHGSLLVREVAF